MTELEAGTLLIASPGLLDPNFRRCVVLICDHGPHSTMGLVLNRPLQMPVSRFFPEVENSADAGFVHCGGPVETNRMLVIGRHGSSDAPPQIFQDVTLVGDIDDALRDIRETPSRAQDYRFFLGYAGWGEGQLDQELSEEAWIVRPATATLLFTTPPAQIWSQSLREMGGLYALFAEMPLDPTMN